MIEKEPNVLARTADLKSAEIELLSGNPKIFYNIGDNTRWNISRVPGKGNQTIGAKGIGVMPVATGASEMFTPDFPQTSLQLAAIERGIFAHSSSSEHKFIAKCGRNRAPRVQQRFEMRLGRQLKTQNRFTAIAAMRVAARQQAGFGNPYSVLVLPRLDFRDRNDHSPGTIPVGSTSVNALGQSSI
jgi:hypothetical protein